MQGSGICACWLRSKCEVTRCRSRSARCWLVLMFLSLCVLYLLYDDCARAASAVAQCGASDRLALLLEYADEGADDTRARATNRMTEGHSTKHTTQHTNVSIIYRLFSLSLLLLLSVCVCLTRSAVDANLLRWDVEQLHVCE